jgi:integrase
MSVRKRIWKTAAGDERQAWIVDYADQAGKRRLKTFARKKDADAYEVRTKVDIGEGVHTADSASITIAAASELWLTTCRGRGLERSTITFYEQTVRLHIVPALGNLKLSRLTPPLVREFEDRMREGETSSAMMRKIRTNLGAILSDAQERGLVARNVVKDLKARRTRGVDRRADNRAKGKLKVGVDIPSRQEIKDLVANLRGRWRPILITAIFTGLRASELRGLRWVDIDFEKNELHVRQRADRYLKIGPPKSESGERFLPLPPIVANTLRKWRLACPRGGLAFSNGSGKVESHPNILQRGLIPAMLAAGIVNPDGSAKYTGLHALRHFYASWCVNSREDGGLGLSAKAAQSRLGHSTIAMTLDTYGHLFPSGDDGSELQAAEKALLG